MPYIEVRQEQGGWGYGMSGPYGEGAIIQGRMQGVYVTIQVHDQPARLMLYQEGKEPTVSKAILLDGIGRGVSHRVLTPIDYWEVNHISYLKTEGEAPIIGGIWRSQIGELLPKYFQQGIELAGADLPKIPLKDKVIGFMVQLIAGS